MTTTTPPPAPALCSYGGRRVAVIGVALCLHAAILYAFLSALTVTPGSAPEQSILVTTIINKTHPPSRARKLPTITAPPLRPAAPAVLGMTDLRIGFPPAPVPRKTPTQQVAERSGSSLVPSVPGGNHGSSGSGPVVLDRVLPDYSLVPYDQQGTVWIRVLVAKSGHVSTAQVEQTSHSPLIDRAALHAVSQWRFEPQSTPRSSILGFTYAPYPRWLFNGPILLDTFNGAYAQEMQAAAAPQSNSPMQSPVSSRKVSRLIASLQRFHASQYRQGGAEWARQFPVQSLLATWGDIQSVQLVAAERVGLAFDSVAHQMSQEAQWQLYAVKQQQGTFIWFVGINARGHIDALEGLACVTTCLADDHSEVLEARDEDGARGNHDQIGPQVSSSIHASAHLPAQSDDSCATQIAQIPSELRATLQKVFPTFRFPSDSDYDSTDVKQRREHGGAGCPGITSGAFYGARGMAYALNLSDGAHSILVVARRENRRYSCGALIAWGCPRVAFIGGEFVTTWINARIDVIMNWQSMPLGGLHAETLMPGDYESDSGLVDAATANRVRSAIRVFPNLSNQRIARQLDVNEAAVAWIRDHGPGEVDRYISAVPGIGAGANDSNKIAFFFNGKEWIHVFLSD